MQIVHAVDERGQRLSPRYPLYFTLQASNVHVLYKLTDQYKQYTSYSSETVKVLSTLTLPCSGSGFICAFNSAAPQGTRGYISSFSGLPPAGYSFCLDEKMDATAQLWASYAVADPISEFQLVVKLIEATVDGEVLRAKLDLLPSAPFARSADKKAMASLTGDFTTADSMPQFSDRLLFVPIPQAGSDLAALGIDAYMMVPRSMVSTDGTECNKVGAALPAFLSQPAACLQPPHSCLGGSLQALFQEDLHRRSKNEAAKYLLNSFSNFNTLQSGYLSTVVYDSMSFFLTLEFNADALQWITNEVLGMITKVTLETVSSDAQARKAAEPSAATRAAATDSAADAAADMQYKLTVNIKNTGRLLSQFQVAVRDCSEGIDDIPTQLQALEPFVTQRKAFTLKQAASAASENSKCTVYLLGPLAEVLDEYVVQLAQDASTNLNEQEGGGLVTPSSSAWQPGGQDCVESACAWYDVACMSKQTECAAGSDANTDADQISMSDWNIPSAPSLLTDALTGLGDLLPPLPGGLNGLIALIIILIIIVCLVLLLSIVAFFLVQFLCSPTGFAFTKRMLRPIFFCCCRLPCRTACGDSSSRKRGSRSEASYAALQPTESATAAREPFGLMVDIPRTPATPAVIAVETAMTAQAGMQQQEQQPHLQQYPQQQASLPAPSQQQFAATPSLVPKQAGRFCYMNIEDPDEKLLRPFGLLSVGPAFSLRGYLLLPPTAAEPRFCVPGDWQFQLQALEAFQDTTAYAELLLPRPLAVGDTRLRMEDVNDFCSLRAKHQVIN